MSLHYITCPYCNKETSLELEDVNPYGTYKEECENCKKWFKFNCEFSIDIYPDKIEEVKQ